MKPEEKQNSKPGKVLTPEQIKVLEQKKIEKQTNPQTVNKNEPANSGLKR